MSQFLSTYRTIILLSYILGVFASKHDTTAQKSAPVVDLGYAVHRAVVNTTGAYYNFSNIRYAEPPVGRYRFRQAVAPTTINRTIQDAPPDRICFQGGVAWQATAGSFIGSILAGPNASLAGGIDHPAANPSVPANPSAPTAGQTEDCLFLDVVAPKPIFDDEPKKSSGKGAPVLIMIHGGGFAQGSKTAVGNSAGLLAEGMRNGGKGFVYVQINYRLGLFGFPPKQINDTDTSSNAGLHDQRLAISWVQQHIHLFGGNPNDITLMGESAGANSIMLHITSYGGLNGPLPFQKAILQSPAWRPASTAAFYQDLYSRVLSVANVTCYDELRGVDSGVLQEINNEIIGMAPYGTFGFGTNIDSNYLPAAPSILLSTGDFHPNLSLLITHTTKEGLLFTSPLVKIEPEFTAFLQSLAIGASPSAITHLSTTIYPPIFNGSYPYTSQTARLALAVREGVVESNVLALNKAFKGRTWGYTFGEFPGLHGQDLGYVFWNGEEYGPYGDRINKTVISIIQGATVRFVERGDPNVREGMGGEGEVDLPRYGREARVLFLNSSVVRVQRDQAANERAGFWGVGLYEM